MGKKRFFYRKPVSVKEDVRPNFYEKPVEPEESLKKIEIPQENKKAKSIQAEPSTQNPVLGGLRYVYLFTFFALLSGVFYPIVMDDPNQDLYNVTGGLGILFLGLVGGILIFKSITTEKTRGIFFVIGFGLIGASLALMFLISNQYNINL
jgi:hypothetical protein